MNLRRLLSGLSLFLLGATFCAAAPKSVLILHSYRSGYEWSADIDRSLHQSFRESTLEIATWAEFLDAARNPNWKENFLSTFNSRYRNRRFDLAVLIDDEAVSLWCDNPSLFAGIPVVFAGVTTTPSCAGRSSTGLLEHFNIEGLLRFGLSIRPSPPEIVILTEDTTLARFLRNTLLQTLSPANRARVKEWNASQLTFSSLLSQVASLNPESIIFICGFTHDSSGTYLAPAATFVRIGKASTAPVIALAHHAVPGILAGSPNGGLSYGTELASLALQILSGISPNNIPVKSNLQLPPQMEASELLRWNIPEDRLPANAEIVNRNPTFFSRYRDWIVAGAIFFLGQSILSVLLGLNILARRRAQKELKDSHALLEQQNEAYRRALSEAAAAAESKSRFVANMSHELRTPLNGVLGISELLLDSPHPPLELNYISTIRSSADHLLVLVNDILDISQLDGGRLRFVEQPFSPAQIVTESIQLITPSTPLPLHQNLDPMLPDWVSGDPARVRQILLNLLGNALKFTEKGCITVGARTESGSLVFSVEDTGVGIPSEMLSSIFGRFTQVDDSRARRHGGLGLGLNIASELAVAMGGSLSATSVVGKGSCFSLRIPLKLAARPLPASSETADLQFLKGRNILVVEDNPVNRTIVCRILERAGSILTTAEHGAAAILACESATFDLVLMDLQMPVMDGFEATTKIRALDNPNANVPIIALTASAMTGERERCLAAGMNDHLTKPIDRQTLHSMLEIWLPASISS